MAIPIKSKLSAQLLNVFNLVESVPGMTFKQIVEYFGDPDSTTDRKDTQLLLASLARNGYAGKVGKGDTAQWYVTPDAISPLLRHNTDTPQESPGEWVLPPVSRGDAAVVVHATEAVIPPVNHGRKAHRIELHFDAITIEEAVGVAIRESGISHFQPVPFFTNMVFHFGQQKPNWGPNVVVYHDVEQIKITYKQQGKFLVWDDTARGPHWYLTIMPGGESEE